MRKWMIMGVLVFVVGCQVTAVSPTPLPPSTTATAEPLPEPTSRPPLKPTTELELAPQQPINSESETIEEIMPTEQTVPMPSNPAEAKLIQQAVSDLSQRLSVSEDRISLVGYERVVWPDAGLGCPQPGMAYTQVQRDGYRILLQYGKRTFAYHGGGNRGPFLCEKKATGGDVISPSPGFNE